MRGALIIHNTVISPYAFKSKDAPASAIRLEDSTASNNDIANNLLVVDQADSRAMEGLGQGNRFANNLIWVKTPAVAGDALPSGGALSSQDPLLTAVGGVYRPSSSSPVVNAGAKGFAASVVADIDGETRDKSPDVGCDEVRSASSSPRRRAKDLLPAWIVSRYTL